MILDIVTYNKKYVNYGIRLIYIAIFLILICFIPDVTKNYGSEILYCIIIFLTLGVVIENYFAKKITKVGDLIIEEEFSIINLDSTNRKITNLDFLLKISEKSYKGESNYDPVLGTGLFSVHSGVVLISLENEKDKFTFEVVIPNKHYLKMLIEFANYNFKNENEEI